MAQAILAIGHICQHFFGRVLRRVNGILEYLSFTGGEKYTHISIGRGTDDDAITKFTMGNPLSWLIDYFGISSSLDDEDRPNVFRHNLHYNLRYA